MNNRDFVSNFSFLPLVCVSCEHHVRHSYPYPYRRNAFPRMYVVPCNNAQMYVLPHHPNPSLEIKPPKRRQMHQYILICRLHNAMQMIRQHIVMLLGHSRPLCRRRSCNMLRVVTRR